jgi:hypothetical protein
MKLQLGFENIPYSQRYAPQSPFTATMKKRAPKNLSKPQQAYGQGKTVGQVAEEIEKKYHLVEVWYTFEEDFIVKNFEEAYALGMEDGMMSGPWDAVWDPAPALEPKFRQALSRRKFDGLIHGVPTRAAQTGVSHLRQNPYAPRAPRPSFIDTSLYQRSFKAWTEA